MGAPTERTIEMKYILLIYNNMAEIQSLPDDERSALFADIEPIMDALRESGEILGFGGLADVSNTKTVRVRDGVPAITDGPFVESKEQLGGYLIVECETPERATEIAASWPDAKLWALEVRPMMASSGTEM